MAKDPVKQSDGNPFGLPVRNSSLNYLWNSSHKAVDETDQKVGVSALRRVLLWLFVGVAAVTLLSWMI